MNKRALPACSPQAGVRRPCSQTSNSVQAHLSREGIVVWAVLRDQLTPQRPFVHVGPFHCWPIFLCVLGWGSSFWAENKKTAADGCQDLFKLKSSFPNVESETDQPVNWGCPRYSSAGKNNNISLALPLMVRIVCWFPVAGCCHILPPTGWLETDFFIPSRRGHKSKIMTSSGLVPSADSGEECVSGLSPASGAAADPGAPWLRGT